MSARTLEEWHGKAEYDVGVMIGRYLAENPPPPGPSPIAAALEDWALKLRDSGTNRLAAVNARPLALAGYPPLAQVPDADA